ncbi:hypothetical protein FHS43_000026 [Streptosporangium becharense]|uniref:Uncharacterized protein n=1 Tax=Streptosporangium becharense TaxID=1816182 RepID=A0A7W9IGA0_9ACTN|nr:hypothetical protein [Streptosporangium becharense]MBB2908780.1 hypothetical protein [Streptosporangium becharense]MBB5820202.1 hypothetical protein [Streptosporangium becharense]
MTERNGRVTRPGGSMTRPGGRAARPDGSVIRNGRAARARWAARASLAALLALLTAFCGLTAVLGTGTASAASVARALPSGVVVVGLPGLEWSDLDPARTPNLWRLVAEGGAASMSTRAVPLPERGVTCPVAGWLTVSAGQRAGAPGAGCTAPRAPEPVPGGGVRVPDWAELTAFNAATDYRPVLGQVGQLAADAGVAVAAIGPGAALGAADKSGNVAKYAASVEELGDPVPYRLIMLEAGDLTRAWLGGDTAAGRTTGPTAGPAPGTTPSPATGATTGPTAGDVPPAMTERTRRDAVVRADRTVGTLLGRLPSRPAGTTVLVAGLADTSTTPHLHVAIAHGPSAGGEPYPRGRLTATSTRQDGLVTNTDLTATVVGLLGLAVPKGVVGRAWEGGGPVSGPVSARVAELADDDLANQVLREVRGPFFAVFVAVQILFYLLAAVAIRRGWGGSRALTAVQVVAVVSGAVAVSTFLAQLVPWWSLPVPMAGVIVTILGIACAIAALAFAGPWRAHPLGPLTAVAAITSVALLADVMTGSALQVNAVTGYEPIIGGRFYGFSNIAFAVFSAGTILALAGVAQWLLSRGRRALALAVCAVYGGFAVFADGWPAWGADFGGVPAFLVGVAVLLILLSGSRVSPVKLGLVGLAGGLLIGAIAVADWLRPADRRTHLGVFVQQVLDGEAWTVVGRKFRAMIGVTVGNWSLSLLSLVALAFLFLVLNRPSRWGAPALGRAYALAPALRAGLLGALACALIGFLMNDSGIAIPAMALTVAVPLTLAACVRVLQLSPPTTAERPSTPAASTAPPSP